MDEENSGAPQQDPNAQPTPTGATATTESTGTAEVIGAGADLGAQSPIVDKTLGEIASGVVKQVETDAKDSVDTTVAKVEAKVNHEAHSILDELEAHLSQFDARVVAIYHSFLTRLRNAV